MVQRRRLTAALMVALSTPVMAGELRYVANENYARWQTETSKLSCELSHTISLYGRAVFVRHAGEPLQFRLVPSHGPSEEGVARVVSTAPSWRYGELPRDLGRVNFAPAPQPFQLEGPLVRRLLLELERGMYPTFSYKDWSDGRDRVKVAISSVNIRDELDTFLSCLDSQLDFGLEDVRVSRIQFGFDSSELSVKARERLQQVGEYLLADPSIREVELEGLTDKTGFRRYNEALARRRADSVRNFFVDMGVPENLFSVTAIGERRPVATNRTAKGRATNRAVIVSLTQ